MGDTFKNLKYILKKYFTKGSATSDEGHLPHKVLMVYMYVHASCHRGVTNCNAWGVYQWESYPKSLIWKCIHFTRSRVHFHECTSLAETYEGKKMNGTAVIVSSSSLFLDNLKNNLIIRNNLAHKRLKILKFLSHSLLLYTMM